MDLKNVDVVKKTTTQSVTGSFLNSCFVWASKGCVTLCLQLRACVLGSNTALVFGPNQYLNDIYLNRKRNFSWIKYIFEATLPKWWITGLCVQWYLGYYMWHLVFGYYLSKCASLVPYKFLHEEFEIIIIYMF